MADKVWESEVLNAAYKWVVRWDLDVLNALWGTRILNRGRLPTGEVVLVLGIERAASIPILTANTRGDNVWETPRLLDEAFSIGLGEFPVLVFVLVHSRAA